MNEFEAGVRRSWSSVQFFFRLGAKFKLHPVGVIFSRRMRTKTPKDLT